MNGTVVSSNLPTATRRISTTGWELIDISTPIVDNKNIQIKIQPGDASTKRILVGTKNNAFISTLLGDEGTWMLSNGSEGTFTVTSIDEKHIEGTFEGASIVSSGMVMLPKKQVTDGKFYVTF